MEVSEKMHCIEIINPGKNGYLKKTIRNKPSINNNEIVIKVSAAGCNRPDILQRQGKYPPPSDASDLPGLEVAGVVKEKGKNVKRFNIGDKVCALCPGGGYSEYCSVPEGHALYIPKEINMIEAASIPETVFTVWSNVFEKAKLLKNETILIHGGSGGIGTTAIQLASLLGSKVIATAGSEEKCNFCVKLGAINAINYNKKDFEKTIEEITNGKGVDVILDIMGASYLQKNLNIIANDGRISLIGFQGGTKANIDITNIIKRRIKIIGSTLRARSIEEKTRLAKEVERNVWPLIKNKKYKPSIHKVFPLAKAQEAHNLMESSSHMGKIILKI